jgi:hypothetical protein
MDGSVTGMAPPPEGAVVGESVPPESEPDRFDEALIQDVMGLLKGRGHPYVEMNDSELRETAVETIRKHEI